MDKLQDKVKLPREVAEAIDYFRNGTKLDFPTQAIMKVAMEDVRYIGDPYYCNEIKAYVKSVDNLQLLMQALVNGYEVENSLEDKVRELYRISKKVGLDEPYYNGICRGINECLEALNIKIKGVNDHE